MAAQCHVKSVKTFIYDSQLKPSFRMYPSIQYTVFGIQYTVYNIRKLGSQVTSILVIDNLVGSCKNLGLAPVAGTLSYY